MARVLPPCPVCLEDFAAASSSAHLPMVLPCGHSLCRSCLTRLCAAGASVVCPNCRSEHGAARGAATFGANYALVQLIETLSGKLPAEGAAREAAATAAPSGGASASASSSAAQRESLPAGPSPKNAASAPAGNAQLPLSILPVFPPVSAASVAEARPAAAGANAEAAHNPLHDLMAEFQRLRMGIGAQAPPAPAASGVVFGHQAPPPSHGARPEWLRVGDLIDACDATGEWLPAEIVDAKDAMVLVHFEGWLPQWNEWIDGNDGRRVAPFGTRVPPRPAGLRYFVNIAVELRTDGGPGEGVPAGWYPGYVFQISGSRIGCNMRREGQSHLAKYFEANSADLRPAPRPPMDPASLRPEMQVDLLDSQGEWLPARVLEVRDGAAVLVICPGTRIAKQETVADGARLAPSGFFTAAPVTSEYKVGQSVRFCRGDASAAAEFLLGDVDLVIGCRVHVTPRGSDPSEGLWLDAHSAELRPNLVPPAAPAGGGPARPLRDLRPGDAVDARDTVGEWIPARLRDRRDRLVFVHYEQWEAKWDEWLPIDSDRLAPAGSRTGPPHSARFHLKQPVRLRLADGRERVGTVFQIVRQRVCVELEAEQPQIAGFRVPNDAQWFDADDPRLEPR